MTPEELLRSYPQLTLEDIRTAIVYAVETTRELVIPRAISRTDKEDPDPFIQEILATGERFI